MTDKDQYSNVNKIDYRKRRTLSGRYLSPSERYTRLLSNEIFVKFIRDQANQLVSLIDSLPKKPGKRTGPPEWQTKFNAKNRLPDYLDLLWERFFELGHNIRHLLDSPAGRQRIEKKSSAG